MADIDPLGVASPRGGFMDYRDREALVGGTDNQWNSHATFDLAVETLGDATVNAWDLPQENDMSSLSELAPIQPDW